ncbi:MAG: UDP-N-acetylmuramoyl-L-alanine--D-glutamate ligase [Bacilli bacterium]|nr:UDP-N-acetylmuramoyl-L-alanine--D-glutamate ligase [Bacilli bacterium]
MDVKDRRVVVLGLARSGIAAAKLLHEQGAHVVVNDYAPLEKVAADVAALQQLGIEVIVGGHPADLINEQVVLLVKNPGIRYQVAPVQQALQLGIPVVTEVELAGWYAAAPLIGITGSNGKTTTTTLVGEIMEHAGLQPVVAGNIGRALTDVVMDVPADRYIVAELSSFQLMGTRTFHPHIAALINVYPAHLDYHLDMQEYIAAKQKLFANQTAQDYAILNWDQPVLREMAQQVAAKVIPISLVGPVQGGVYVEDGWIIASGPQELLGSETPLHVLPVSSVKLQFEHNLQNILVAVAISLAAGAQIDSIRAVLQTFGGVEHRVEFVREQNGVRYFNDSKATNEDAASRALAAFPGNIIWIAGGLDRGFTFESLEPLMAARVKAVVALGQSQAKVLAAAERAGVQTRIAVDCIENAVLAATERAQPGDTVLLSPACASWDMFSSFEERGRIFKQAVHTM